MEFSNILHTPLPRRLQTLSVLYWSSAFYIFCGITILICYQAFFSNFFRLIILAYVAWYIYDQKTPERGGRRALSMRNWRIWNYFRDYFPQKLIKTAEIDPSKNYLFIYHPHGIIATGAFLNFCTNATNIDKLYPGVKFTLAVLHFQMVAPITREYVMLCGAISARKASLDHMFTKEGKGNAVILVVGGALEALDAHPGSSTLYLNKRKGFIKLALEHGVSVVPIYSFGENEIFVQVDNPPGSAVRRFQLWMTKVLTFSLPFFHGRGVFNYTFGHLPFRRPVNVVVGKPMEVEKLENPTWSMVDEWHAKYVDHLTELFEEHKKNYGIKEEQKLKFV